MQQQYREAFKGNENGGAEGRRGLHFLIGESRAFVDAVRRIPRLAKCDASVCITGETGTGKEVCAQAIHRLGPRAPQPFIPVNCGAIPSELVENELFGHAAGAFTGAASAVRGLLHDAEGGTLFLDEIDCLPLTTQVKFLRLLQEQEYRPLGGRNVCQADVRIIAASNADLELAVQSGRFRPDLFFRINVLALKLPTLRERQGDIPLLARHFVAKYAGKYRIPEKEVSAEAFQKLLAYSWPGNVRELENIIQRALVLSERAFIAVEDICLPEPQHVEQETSFKAQKSRAIAEFEIKYIRQMLAIHQGNITRAARAAGKNRRAFWQLMRKHRIIVADALPAAPQLGQKQTTSGQICPGAPTLLSEPFLTSAT